MKSLPWTPWHQVVALRDDIRSGELSLASFAADLYEVAMQKGQRPIYEDPVQFFALTYPTYNLRELVKDVVQRLAGKNQKAIRQLELTYGGGKTHTLITLFHLVTDPTHLPDLPAVQEFIQHCGMRPPQARVALLPFDKLDVEKGMEVRGPGGVTRWLKQPWSVLAYQLAGDDGLRLLHAEGEAAERETAPAENLLVELLRIPEREGLSILILIDEVLMYAREKVGQDPRWRARLINFFQYLTQAVTKVDHCAMVASLLATDPRKSDTLGKEITQELYAIFRREREEGVQPVLKEDVAEVLRRRFFTPGSIRDRDAFRSHVVAALQGITSLDEQAAQAGKAAEARFLRSYPFHPDLTDIFYTKWTNLEGFQRTRGVLRIFALALRDAEPWDTAPLIGANVFLSNMTTDDTDFTDKKEKSVQSVKSVVLSEAARELTGIAATEEYEGKQQDWSAILLGELEKAQDIQQQYPGLLHREVERAVVGIFLHSQPVGHKALTRDLFLLLGQTRPDKIELEKALHRWVEISWFLDEEVAQEMEETASLPQAWRLGSRPNLTQMHHDACRNRVSPELVASGLLDAIQGLSSLTAGAKGAGAHVHMLPKSPRDVADDGEFHYVVLGPDAACEPGHPSELAQRYLTETTTPDRPRVNKNAVVLVAPSITGLEQARQAIIRFLGWQDVQAQLKKQHELQKSDPLRWQLLLTKLKSAQQAVPSAIRLAYTTVVTWSEQGEIEAFKVKVEDRNLFEIIKADDRARIKEVAITAGALLPGGPYELWREGETARWLKDLVGAFAQHPHLPKMLNRRAILETLVQGCEEGHFVFRMKRPDDTFRTYWRYRPPDELLQEASLEVVLPETAELFSLASSLLRPGQLPGLWDEAAKDLQIAALYAYFSGDNLVKGAYEGEFVFIPGASQAVVDDAVKRAVQSGKLWLRAGPASLWQEEVPPGIIGPAARLLPAPEPLSPKAILTANLPSAWEDNRTTALSLATALSQQIGETLPWPVIRQVINGAFTANYIERAPDSGPWPCDRSGAQNVRLRTPMAPPTPPPPTDETRVTEARLEIYELQDLVDILGEVKKVVAGYSLDFHVRITLGNEPPDAVVDEINALLRGISDKLMLK